MGAAELPRFGSFRGLLLHPATLCALPGFGWTVVALRDVSRWLPHAGYTRRDRSGLTADAEVGEAEHVHAVVGEHLLDRLLRLLDERLLGEHDVGVEAVE